MPKPSFRLYIALSLDGYIATPDGGVDWLKPFDSATAGYAEFISEIGAIVIGRKTYEQVRGFGDWPYAGIRTIVLSSEMLETLPEDTAIWRDGIEVLADELAGEQRDIWVLGGAAVIGSFLQHRLIDRMEMFVMPVLLGTGIRLFEVDMAMQHLRCRDIERFDCGAVRLDYGVDR